MSAGSNPELLSWAEEVAKGVSLPDDIISIVPSSSTGRQARRSRSLSAPRVKAESAVINHRVIYVHESADPQRLAASQLRASGTIDSQFVKVLGEQSSNAVMGGYCRTAVRVLEHPNRVREPQYQPRYTARDPYNRKVDLVVGLPVNAWEAQYETAGLHTPGKYINHMTHPDIEKHALGPGVEIKAADGNLVGAQVQIGVWMTGLLIWAFAQRKSFEDLLPLVGCTAVGEDWKFYMAVGIEGSGVLKEVVGSMF